MGWVWVAHDEQLDVDIAIKLIRDDVSVPAAAERLLTEARALARIEHAGIVHVVDFGRTGRKDPFIAMELLEGEDLGQILEREERLPPIKAVRLLLPVAEALGAAHTRGIVHRDLKPDNVFLVRVGNRIQPKLIDFGIAKLDLQSKHTQAGVALGSPDYMAPEQARGLRDVDHRADIWAFCILVYETITGHVPFEDASYNAVLRHVIESPIPSIFEHGVDAPELWAILQRGFEKDREQRFQSMRELGAALANWLMDQGIREDAAGRSLRAVWIEPRPSRMSIPEILRFNATGDAPRIETSSSIPPISETGHPAPAVPLRGKVALVGLGVFLAGVLGVLVLMHRRVPASHAAASQPASSVSKPAGQPAEPVAADKHEAPPPVSGSAPAASAPAPPSAAPALPAHKVAHPVHAAKAKAHAPSGKASSASGPHKPVAAPAASDLKPLPDDLGF